MTPGYELFDHTADIGVRVWAPSLAKLIPPASEGLYAVLGELTTFGTSAAARSSWTPTMQRCCYGTTSRNSSICTTPTIAGSRRSRPGCIRQNIWW